MDSGKQKPPILRVESERRYEQMLEPVPLLLGLLAMRRRKKTRMAGSSDEYDDFESLLGNAAVSPMIT